MESKRGFAFPRGYLRSELVPLNMFADTEGALRKDVDRSCLDRWRWVLSSDLSLKLVGRLMNTDIHSERQMRRY